MRLRGYRLFKTSLRCKRPFVLANEVCDLCHGLLLELTTEEGLQGWGECVPTPRLMGDTLSGTQEQLETVLLPYLLEVDLNSYRAVLTEVAELTANRAARTACDLAVFDLLSVCSGLPLCRWLGGRQTPVSTDYSIGIESLEDTVELARQAFELGYRTIKMKVGAEPGDDAARVAAVRTALPQATIFLDANGGWSPLQARRAFALLEPHRVAFIEQPLARGRLRETADLRRRFNIPIAADESVHDADDAVKLLSAEAADILNLKLMKCGGILPGIRLVEVARAFGAEMMVGGMVGESSLAVGAATALASAFGFEHADLDADLLLADQLFDSPPAYEPPLRKPATVPGHGLGQPQTQFCELLAEVG